MGLNPADGFWRQFCVEVKERNWQVSRDTTRAQEATMMNAGGGSSGGAASAGGGGGSAAGSKRGRNGNPSTRSAASLNPTGAPAELQVDATAEAVKGRFLQFLCGYGQQSQQQSDEMDDGDDADAPMRPTVNYSHQAEVMRNTETSSLFVDFTHVLEFDPDLAHAIQAQYYRWEPYLRTSVFEFIRMEDAAYTINEDANKTQREFFVCFYNFQHVSQ